jgi:hypothetical protein
VTTLNLPLRRSGTRTHGGPLRGLRQYLGSRPGLGRNFLVILAVIILGVAAAGIVLSHEDLIFPWQHEVTYYADFSLPGSTRRSRWPACTWARSVRLR